MRSLYTVEGEAVASCPHAKQILYAEFSEKRRQVISFALQFLSVEKTDVKYNYMHTAAHRNTAALRRAAVQCILLKRTEIGFPVKFFYAKCRKRLGQAKNCKKALIFFSRYIIL